jgi:Lon protease-like protein
MPRELPIVPLPLVLFPGAVQPLHIFEPRYRAMLKDCLEGDRRFGIAYVAPAAAGADPAPEPGEAGCVAVIRSAEALPDGRANIVAVGERRFTLRRWLATERPYRVGEVEEFDDEPGDAAGVAELAGEVRGAFARLVRALDALTERDEDAVALASDPALLSFQVAAALELDVEAKRALLASRSARARLRQLAALLRPLAADAERRAAVHRAARGNGRGRGASGGSGGSGGSGHTQAEPAP